MARSWNAMATGVAIAAGVATALVCASILVSAQQSPADLILYNGKIITVDNTFSIAQAVAVRGDRIVEVGTDQEINQLAGPNTRRIDLEGKSVTPGFIDNHAHFMEEGAYWTLETRLDGIESRTQALEILRAAAEAKGPGEWVFTIGGWSPDQFADDSRFFTRDELDEVLPDNPLYLQVTRDSSFVNSRAIEAVGIDKMTDPAFERNANGRLTGVITNDEAADDVKTAAGFLRNLPEGLLESSSLQMLKDFSKAGLTASAGSCQYVDLYRRFQQEGRLSMRFFCFRGPEGGGGGGRGGGGRGGGGGPASDADLYESMASLKYFDGDEWIDHVNRGERLIRMQDAVTDMGPSESPEAWDEWGRVALAAARARIPLQIHTTMEWTIEEQLKQVEKVNQQYPIRNLRWAFMHMEQVTPDQIERMKKLNMFIALNPRTVVAGMTYIRRHGERGYTMPNLKAIQDSGIMWGLGTDAFEVNQYRPFTTLYWAVTGKMVGGKVVTRYPIGRVDALIAHTRSNAFLFSRENDLGSIAKGRFADMVVLNKDYLTVPADEIKEIESVLTIVGGRIAYDAAAEASTQ